MLISLAIKEYLSQTFFLEKEIKAKKKSLKYLEDLKYNISSLLLGEKVVKTVNVTKIQDVIAASMDLEKEYIEKIQELIELQKEIKKLIESLENPKYRLVLTLRYIHCKKWGCISQELNYSLEGLKKIHSNALKVFSEKNEIYKRAT